MKNCYSINSLIGDASLSIQTNIEQKTAEQIKSNEFLTLMNTQVELDKTEYSIDLKRWVTGDESTNGFPKFAQN